MKKWIVFFACFIAVTVHAQKSVTLPIGDPAPALKYSKWIKGTPVNSFKGDQLYILEFWSTWCHPCIEAMPHLTQIQKKYKGKATIIGVNIWELTKGEPYESTVPKVTRFVERNSANMGFSVMADNNDQYMASNWLKAAGLSGIPSTFIIQNEKIVWIGGPSELDSTLGLMMSGRYNMQEYKQVFEKKAVEMTALLKEAANRRLLEQPVEEALKAKEYEKALALIDKLIVEHPDLKQRLYYSKFLALLNVRQEEAIAYGETWQKEGQMADIYYILTIVAKHDGLAKKNYIWAAKNFMNANKRKMNPMNQHLLALCYAKGGDYKNATVMQEKAVKSARTALKNEEYSGFITDKTIAEYEEALAKYRKAGKNQQSEKLK